MFLVKNRLNATLYPTNQIFLLFQPNFDFDNKSFVETTKICLGQQQFFWLKSRQTSCCHKQTVFSMLDAIAGFLILPSL